MQSKLPSVKDIAKNLSNEQKIEMLDILCGQLTSSALHSKDKISQAMLESITQKIPRRKAGDFFIHRQCNKF